MFKTIKIRSYEIGLHFRDGEFKGLLDAGRHWFFDLMNKVKVEVVSQRAPWSGAREARRDRQGRCTEGPRRGPGPEGLPTGSGVGGRAVQPRPAPGLYAYWTTFREVAIEVIDARKVRFEHKDLQVIVRSALAERVLDTFAVEQGHVGVLFEDGRYVETLPPGKYAFWKSMAKVVVVPVDLRETMLDIGGQEIMTADKVTLRLNAVATYRVANAHKALSAADDVRQALYREAQLALRAVIGGRELDQFLADKDAVAKELEAIVRQRVATLGLEIVSVGIRDVILPGDMKDLMNKVTEAKKAAEANLIVRREETAAMRSQSNTAKLLEGNPTLMRLRELEVLEKVAAGGKLNVVLGEKGLAERVVNLL